MKRILILVMVAMLGMVAVALADEAKKEEAKPVTLTGEVIDMYCYMDHKALHKLSSFIYTLAYSIS